jgi:hypothetical protein
MSTRLPALVTWLTAASVPPTMAAASSAVGPSSPTAPAAMVSAITAVHRYKPQEDPAS